MCWHYNDINASQASKCYKKILKLNVTETGEWSEMLKLALFHFNNHYTKMPSLNSNEQKLLEKKLEEEAREALLEYRVEQYPQSKTVLSSFLICTNMHNLFSEMISLSSWTRVKKEANKEGESILLPCSQYPKEQNPVVYNHCKLNIGKDTSH